MAKDPEAIKDYELKEGMEHSYVRDGEVTVAVAGDKVPLSEAQVLSFKDKFIIPVAKGDEEDESGPENTPEKVAPAPTTETNPTPAAPTGGDAPTPAPAPAKK